MPGTIVTTPLCTLNSTTDGSASPASTSGTPVEGDLLVGVFYCTQTVIANPTLTASANGLTFTLVNPGGTESDTAADRMYWFVADQLVGPAPAAMTVQMGGFAADQASGWIGVLIRITGLPSVPSSVKFAEQANKAGGVAAQVTLSTAATDGNPVIAAQGNNNNPPGQTPPAGWTEIYDAGFSTPTTGLHVMGRTTFTGTTITWSSTSGAGGAGAIELQFPTGVTGAGGATAHPAAAAGTATVSLAGDGSPDAPAATADGTGTVKLTGAGQAAPPPADAAGAGDLTTSGAGATTAAPATADGTGELTFTGAGAPTAQTPDAAGTGDLTITGTGTATAAPGKAKALTGDVIDGSGAALAPAGDATLDGVLTVEGAGASSTDSGAADGTGITVIAGAGSATAAAAQTDATGSVAPSTDRPPAGRILAVELTSATATGELSAVTATSTLTTPTATGELS